MKKELLVTTLESTGEVAKKVLENGTTQELIKENFNQLAPFLGVKKLACEEYIKAVEESNMTREQKVIAKWNAKKVIKYISNQQSIAQIANSFIKDGRNKQEVDEDLFDRYMESAKYVTNEEMQIIWGKILANEINEPGTMPPSMIRILSEFTPRLATVFTKLVQMNVSISLIESDESNPVQISDENKIVMVPYQNNEEQFKELGINFVDLEELDTLGVIRFSSFGGFSIESYKNKDIILQVNSKLLRVSEINKELAVGNVMLTSTGYALANIIEGKSIPEYDDMIVDFLTSRNVTVEEIKEV